MINDLEVRLPHKEWQKFILENEGAEIALKPFVRLEGPKVVIHLQQILDQKVVMDQRVMDRLYGYALNLREERFLSYFYQLKEVLALPRSRCQSILEIGRGLGVFQALAKNFQYKVTALDLDRKTAPDVLADIRKLPFKENSFDMVCAFEVLEHLPYDQFRVVIEGMAKCARNYLFLSLPARVNDVFWQVRFRGLQRFLKSFSFEMQIFKTLPLRSKDIDVNPLTAREDRHNPHYWEVNRRSYPKQRIWTDLRECGLEILKEFHNPHYSFHYFILCQVPSK